MPNDLKILVQDVRNFLDLLLEDNNAWKNWTTTVSKISNNCWELKQCSKSDCPAYHNTVERCWLITNTLCGFKHKCECPKCDVYVKTTHIDHEPTQELAEHIRTMIYNMGVINSELEIKANKDCLTGLFNKNYFHEIMPRELDRIRRYKTTQCLFLLDINKFKNINDTHGHIYGDYILSEVGKILTNCCRSSDYVFRYGGDEFLILSVNTCCENNAESLVSRINNSIKEWNSYCYENINLSISTGYSLIDGSHDIESIIRIADANMYENKRTEESK